MLKVHWIRVLVLILAIAALIGMPGKSSAAQTSLIVGIDCIQLPGQLRCTAEVTGGTGIYTYQWTPTPASGGGRNARFGCSGKTIFLAVTVTDSNGATGSDSGTFFCGGTP
jgi:hypothetical protein